MAHSNRSTRKVASMAKKRAIKSAQKAKYAAYRDSGNNSKSARKQRISKKKRGMRLDRVSERNRRLPTGCKGTVSLKKIAICKPVMQVREAVSSRVARRHRRRQERAASAI